MLSKLLNLFCNKDQKNKNNNNNNNSNRDTIIIQQAINWACHLGKLDIIQQFHETAGVNFFDPEHMTTASVEGHLEVVKYLHETVGAKCAKCATYAMNWSSRNGHLEVVKYLHEIVGAECTTNAMDWASSRGHLEVVKYLHETVGVKCTTDAIKWASELGHLEVVMYLTKTVDVDVDIIAESVICARKNGFLNIVKYLKEENGIKIISRALKVIKCKDFVAV